MIFTAGICGGAEGEEGRMVTSPGLLGNPRLSEYDVARVCEFDPDRCGFDAGLVPEPTVQREADEAAECSGRTAARLLQGPEEDEAPGRPAGGPGHSRTRGLRILRR